jgi:hypothetical protein
MLTEGVRFFIGEADAFDLLDWILANPEGVSNADVLKALRERNEVLSHGED